jgi:hypothetical protein
LIPFVALPEDGDETHDEEEGDEEDAGIEIGAVGLHIRPLIPTRSETYNNGYDK